MHQSFCCEPVLLAQVIRIFVLLRVRQDTNPCICNITVGLNINIDSKQCVSIVIQSKNDQGNYRLNQSIM